ncbi:MAG: hypothetical protein J6I62_00170 [Selenomonadaceae bacterium]|nr:hypothetical protein [Selenomonadaceae bacterium]
MIIKTYIPENQPLTAEEIKEIETAAKYPITFDDDCPELTDEQIEKFFSSKGINISQKNQINQVKQEVAFA